MNQASLTVLALEGRDIAWEAAAVKWRALLHMEVWRGHGRRHASGLGLRGEQPQLLAADVEPSRADEGPAVSGRAGAGGDGAGHRRGGRRARGGRAAPRLQGEVVWAEDSQERWFNQRNNVSHTQESQLFVMSLLLPDDGESLYCDAGLLPLNKKPDSGNKKKSHN